MRKKVTRQVEETGYIEDAFCCHICVNYLFQSSLATPVAQKICSYWNIETQPTERCGAFNMLKGTNNVSNI